MYTSYIGLKFLDLFNRKTGKQYTAAEFFDKEMFPLFFDNQRHLMHVSNSPFFQSPSEKELKQSGLALPQFQYQKLRQKITGAVELVDEQPDASFYVGYAANGPDQTTAGQVTNLTWAVSESELYASWIGNALAARVEGSQCLLMDSERVLWHLYEGWKVYRQYLEPLEKMDGRQIETWNGYWLAEGSLDRPAAPRYNGSKLETYPWVEVLASLLQWHSGEAMPAYIFSLGQTNTTYGFINIRFPELQRLSQARLAIKKSVFTYEPSEIEFWREYAPDFTLREACQLGEIGLKALRPKDFGKLMEGNFTNTKLNEKNKHTFLNIQTWIIAMLNNKSDLQLLAAALATELVAAELKGTGKERGKQTDAAETKALLEAKGLTTFIDALTSFLDKNNGTAVTCKQVVDQAIRIPGDQFPLFKALIRFEYIYQKNS
jgi:hypothetical protein